MIIPNFFKKTYLHYLLKNTRKLLLELGHTPRRFLGQNFLVEKSIIFRSLQLASISNGDIVLEIGAGLGVLTQALLETGAIVHAVECDNSLVYHLRSKFSTFLGTKLKLIKKNALEVPIPLGFLKSTFKIVSNLPYAIATTWLEKVINNPILPLCMVLMLQKETAVRMTSHPGSKNYCAISIFLSSTYHVRSIHRVGSKCFYPVPKVNSTLIAFDVLQKANTWSAEVSKIVRYFFTLRRKKISTILRKCLHKNKIFTTSLQIWFTTLTNMGIYMHIRPEEITLSSWKIFLHIYSIFS